MVNPSKLLNQIIGFFMGLFVSAIFFFLILKLLGGWGIFVALLIGFAVNYWLKQKFSQHYLLKIFNIGLFTFNIITTVTGLVAYVVFYSAMQNLLS
jgi:hypothetical protein